MNLDKNIIIYILVLLSFSLAFYILFQEPCKSVTVNVVHEKEQNSKNETNYNAPIVYEKSKPSIEAKAENIKESIIIDEKLQTITSENDSRFKYQVALVSKVVQSNTNTSKKVILNGKIINNEYNSVFILEADHSVFEEQTETFIQVKEKKSNKIIRNYSNCLNGLIPNLIYIVRLEVIEDELICEVSKDREIEKSKVLKSIEEDIKKALLLKKDGIKTEPKLINLKNLKINVEKK